MVSFIFFIICFFASIAGAICGIGGGVIIKPALDAFHIMDVAVISFLSGCTVLSMSTYSVIKSTLSKHSYLDPKISFPLAIGSSIGGLLGKWLFSFILSLSKDTNQVGAIQTFCLLAITIGTLLYTLYKEKIKTYRLTNKAVCLLIGSFLGILSSFLGIGGGPINLIVLFFFFSMDTKSAIFPDKPIRARPADTRMGKGKGNVDYWVAVVKPGRVMFELGGVSEEVAREAMRLAANKLPVKCKFVKKEEEGGEQ